MMRSNLQWLLAAALLLAAGAAFWQHREINRLRRESARLPELRAEAERLRQEQTGPAGPPADSADAGLRRAETLELARLRNTVRQLRDQVKTAAAATNRTIRVEPAPENSNPRRKPAIATIPFATAANVGRATPEATVQTLLWSFREGGFDGMSACLTPRARESMDLSDPDRAREKFAAESAQIKDSLEAMEILARQQSADGIMKLGLRIRISQEGNQQEEETALSFVQVNGEWLLDQAP